MKHFQEREEHFHHAGGAPDVSWCVIVSTNQNLHRAVLTRLDVFSEVFMLITRDDILAFIAVTDL